MYMFLTFGDYFIFYTISIYIFYLDNTSLSIMRLFVQSFIFRTFPSYTYSIKATLYFLNMPIDTCGNKVFTRYIRVYIDLM